MPAQVVAPLRDGALLRGLTLWFLLLSIFTHALVPMGAPLQRITGSAFSASTADVSLAPSRQSLAKQLALAKASDDQAPDGAGLDDPTVALPSQVAVFAAHHHRSTARAMVHPALASDGGAAAFEPRAPPSA